MLRRSVPPLGGPSLCAVCSPTVAAAGFCSAVVYINKAVGNISLRMPSLKAAAHSDPSLALSCRLRLRADDVVSYLVEERCEGQNLL